MATRIQLRRDTAANWTSVNPVLAQGELGLNLDTNQIKIGDGSTAWNSLSYTNLALDIDDLNGVTITDPQNGDFLRYNSSASAWINDPVNLSTDTVGDYVQSLVAGTGVSITNNSGEGTTPTIAIGQAVNTSSSVTFAHINAPVTGNVVGNLTGDVTGNADTASALETSRTISLTGDVSGSVSFDGSGDVSITTTVQPNSIALGTDTTGNYVNDITAGTGVTVTHTPSEGSSPTIAIGQAVGTSSSVTFAHVSAPITGNVVGDLTGNADTASTLETSRTIAISGDVSGSVSFDGSSDVTISATIQPNSVALGTDTTGNYVNDITAGTGVTVTHTPGEGSSPTVAIGQAVGTSSSVTFAHVAADVTGDLTGNADTATALQTARTIELSGDVSGSASFDGTAAINIFTTVNTSSVAIGELGGVNITNPEEYQVIQYNGTEWINDYPDTVSYVRNVDTVTLTSGTAVYLYGGNGDHATVKRADNSSDATSSKTIGLVGASIAQNENGPVVTRGYVDGMNLSVGYNVGDVLWLGKNGQFTTNKPSAPDHLVFLGVVVRATNNGLIYVAAQNGYEIEELHNVKINGVTDGQFLRYNSASTMWVNDTVNLGTDTAGDYVQSLVAGTGITLSNNSGESATPTIAIGQDVSQSASVTFARVTVQGDLDVQGTITRINETNLEVEDTFIYLNATSASVNPDFGFAANYNDGTYRHAGFFRDASDGIFKVFDSYEPEPENPINVSDASYSDAPLQAERFISTTPTGTAPLSVSSSTVVTNLNADKLDGQDSSYFAPINSPTFTGTVTLPNNTVALGTQTTGNYVGDVTGGTGVTIVHTPGEGTSPQVSIGQDVATSASVTFAHVSAPLTGNVTGNASTATTLQTARTISISGDVTGSVSFNGSGNVDIEATIQPNSVALGTDTTGDYVASVAVSGTGLSVSGTGENASVTVTSNATSNNTVSTIVARDSSGNFSAGTITAALSGNASTATNLATSRNIQLTGDVTGTASFDGSANAVISTTIASNSVALGSDTTGDYVSSLVAGTGVTLSNNSGESATPTVAIGQAVATSSSVTFAHVQAPITGDVNGNAETASRLQTTRTIQLSGDVSGSVTFDGSNNVNIATTVEANAVTLGTDTTGSYVSSLVAGTGVSLSNNSGESATPTIAIGQDVSTSASVSFAKLTTSDVADIGTNLTVGGQYIRLNESQSASPLLSASIQIERGTQPNVSIRWNEETDVWEFTNDGSTFEEVGSGGGLLVSATAPIDPSEGDLWFDSTSFDTFVYYGTTWVQQNTPPSEIAELGDLIDVLVTEAEPDQVLAYNGTEWESTNLSDLMNANILTKTTDYVLVLTDRSKTIEMSASVANTVTIPTHATAAFPVGSEITVLQYGSGKTQIVPALGVTIRSTVGNYLTAQYSWCKLVKRATNEWYAYGDLSSS